MLQKGVPAVGITVTINSLEGGAPVNMPLGRRIALRTLSARPAGGQGHTRETSYSTYQGKKTRWRMDVLLPVWHQRVQLRS